MNSVTQPYTREATPGAAAAPAAWRPWQIAAAAGLFLAGLWCLRFQLQGLWALWTNDGLRSIGMVLPPLSLWLALRAWSAESWAQGGTWWGLAPLALALGLAAGSDAGAAPLALSLNWHTGMAAFDLAPPGLLLCAYASGTVLLFGGTRAWREAAFPLLLLLFVNPVPRAFNALLDLPLQHFAAQSARSFASLLQVPVSEGTLRMMFAPQLGMFIAPGCDGLRGAAAMGYLALISGYLYRLPRLRWAGFVAGAVLLAYLFNLLRLCGVVMYYWVALRVPAVGDYGVQVDYAIGGTLFCVAAAFLLGLPRRWSAA